MSETITLMGLFDDDKATAAALDEMYDLGVNDDQITVISSIPYPEQALGRPMFQSDVFSLGLVIYQLFSGQLPEWPHKWPPPGYPRIRSKLRPKVLWWLKKAMELRPQERFRNAVAMENAFEKIRIKVR